MISLSKLNKDGGTERDNCGRKGHKQNSSEEIFIKSRFVEAEERFGFHDYNIQTEINQKSSQPVLFIYNRRRRTESERDCYNISEFTLRKT